MRAGEVDLKLTADIADLQSKLNAAVKGVDGFSDRTGAAAKDIQQHADRISEALGGVGSSVYGTTEALKRLGGVGSSVYGTTEALKRLGGAGASAMSSGVGAAAQAAQAQAAQLGATLNSVSKASGVSAQQTAAAWRMLPQQLQDVAVSLQGGMSPFTVLMQQGPQITGAFGGVKATISAFAAAIPPAAVAGSALAAAIGAVALAAYQGSKEQDAFTASLIATNGRIGLTADGLSSMARRMDGVAGVTRGQAAEALAMMARQSTVTAESIQRLTTVAVQLENAGGPAVAETAKQFAALAKDPLAASITLNDATGFLTESIYKQIRALEARGQREAAAKLAQDAYAASAAEQAKAMEAAMGTLERGWLSLKNAAREAWDSMLNIGREDTLDQQIEKALKKVNEAQALVNKGGIKGWFGEKLDSGEQYLYDAQSELYGLQQKKAAEEAAAKAKAEAAKKVEAQIAEDGAVGDKRRAIAAAQLAANLAQSKAAADAAIRVEDDKAAALAATRAAGLVSEQEAARQSLTIEQARLAAKLRLIDAEIKAEKDRPLKADDVVGQLAKQGKLTDLKSQRAGVADQLRMAPISTQWKIEAADLSDARASMQQWAQMWTEVDGKVRTLAEQTAQAQAAMIDAPIAAAAARTDLTIAKLQADADKAKAVYQGLIDALRAKGDTGAADALAGKVQGLDQAVAAQAAAERQKVVMDYLKGSTDALGAGWDNVTRGIGGAVQAMMSLSTEQANYAAALKMAGGDQAKIAQIEQRHLQAQIASYGQMAGAAKGFFKQKTAAYKVLDAAEKASNALQMALAIKTAMEKMGLIEAVTVAKVAGDQAAAASATASVGPEVAAAMAKGQANATAAVANQGNGDPYTAFFRIAAMVALMGALGFAVRGGGSGGSSAPTNSGTGTVLGDPTAKSESISKALESLADVDTMTMQYSAQMAASLRNIEAGIGGMSNLIVRGGGMEAQLSQIATGFSTNAIGQVMGGWLDGKLNGTILGDAARRTASLFGTKTSVVGQGISVDARSLGDILANGVNANYYADVKTKKKTFGMSLSGSKTRTQYMAADAALNHQFGAVLGNMAKTLQAAAGPLSSAMGTSLEQVQAKLMAFTVDIGRINLKGLTGEQISEKLTAVFGSVGDRMAASVLGGLEDFTAVGEGYYETVVRVASGSEEAQQALQNLGIQVVSVGDIINKQADDIGAEIARQSILLAENGGSSITAITQTMSGSAADIASAYTSLLDVREFMRQTGFGATDASQSLLAGAGGLSSLQEGISAYVENFASSAQKTALTTAQMTAQFARLGVSMPADAAGFISLVHGIDTTTESGKKLLGSVLALSGSFASYLDATGHATAATRTAADIASERASLERKLLEVQGDTKAIRALDLASLDESNRALQQRIWALQDEKDRLDALAGAGKGISSLIEELRGGASTSASLAQRRAAYNSELSAAQSGDVTASNSIAATARSLIESLKATATDPLQLAMETSRIAAQLSALPAVEALAQQASDQASTALAAAAQSTSTAAAASAAAASSDTSSTAVSQSATSNDITELSALRATVDNLLSEVKLLRSGQDGGLEAIKANTRRTAQALEGVIADDGVSIAVSVQG